MTKDQTQQLLGQAQLYQQQVQGIMAQKEALNLQLVEISNALDELEKTEGKEVWRIAGPLIIKSSKEEAKRDMDERKELIHNRLTVLEKSEKKVKEKVDELRERLGKTGMGG